MKIESWIFLGGVFFFAPVAVVYGYMTNWSEWVGFLALLMLVGLSAMVGWYLLFTAKRIGPRPEDRLDGEIHENAGDIVCSRPGAGGHWYLPVRQQSPSWALLLAGGSSTSVQDLPL